MEETIVTHPAIDLTGIVSMEKNDETTIHVRKVKKFWILNLIYR